MKKLQSKFKFLIIRVIIPFLIDVTSWLLPRRKKTLLVVKTDGIGDYILFRNFLGSIKKCDLFRGWRIHLLANAASKELALKLDSDIVDQFFWYSDEYFMKWNLIKLIIALQRLRPKTIIYPNYSRRYTIDWLISHVRASHKIAVDGDTINESTDEKSKGNNYYSRLIQANTTQTHEFDRNKIVIDAITGEESGIVAPFIEKEKLTIAPNNSIVIFTGASNPQKTWPLSNFHDLCKKLIVEFALDIVIVGGKGDVKGFKGLTAGLPENRVRVLPDLGLVALCELIGGAKLVLSGDTMAIHVAAALSVPAVCIAKGDLYGRFIPYPRIAAEKMHCVFPTGFEEEAFNYGRNSPFNIANISPEKVYGAIEKTLAISEVKS
jgi:ADP-heptose:LPS heptosyltransferase